VILSEITGKLMAARLPGQRVEQLLPFAACGAHLRLSPASY
jgi:hypothetical protein